MKTGMIFTCTGLLVLFGCTQISAQNRHYTQSDTLDTMLTGYDKRIRPRTTSGTGVRVQANLLIRSIDKVDDKNMDYSLILTFRQEWNDERLVQSTNQTDYLSFDAMADKIWTPDIFFQYEKSAHFHDMTAPNRMVRVHPDGNILMSTRISVVLACPMNFRMYPMDQQFCEIRFASYGFTSKDLDLVWKQTSDATYSPVQVADNLYMLHFTLADRRFGECTSHTATGSYNCLRVSLLLQRNYAYYVTQWYIPTMMLVIISWIAFWLDPEALTVRILLSLLTLLAMVAYKLYINMEMPKVPYSTSIDIWSGICVNFIFMALLESVIVNFLNNRNRDKQRRMVAADPSSFAMKPLLGERGVDEQRAVPSTLVGKLDFFSRIVFPALFLLFNILYWSISRESSGWPEGAPK